MSISSCEYVLCNCIFLSIIMIAIIIIVLIIATVHHKHQKAIHELTKYNINTSALIDDSIPLILENFIMNCFTDYRIISLPLDIGYITEDKMKEMEKEFTDIVVSRLSENMLDKLSLYYNVKNIADIISDKIYIILSNFVIETNSIYNNPNTGNKK